MTDPTLPRIVYLALGGTIASVTSGDPRDFRGLVAEDEGRLLGLAHYVLHPNLWRP